MISKNSRKIAKQSKAGTSIPGVPAFSIIVDTREQLPFSFSWVKPTPPLITFSTLKTGDYSLAGFTDLITIERKSRSDLEGCCTASRERFERELARMADFSVAVVVVEADYSTLLTIPSVFCKITPKSLVGSLIAWKQRYGVHFELCPSRNFAQKITYRHLERFYLDTLDGKRS